MTSPDTTPENNPSYHSIPPQGNEEQEESQNEKGKELQDLISNGQLVKDKSGYMITHGIKSTPVVWTMYLLIYRIDIVVSYPMLIGLKLGNTHIVKFGSSIVNLNSIMFGTYFSMVIQIS